MPPEFSKTVLVTDVQYRKAFDVCNIVRQLGHTVVPCRSATGPWQWAKTGFGFPEKIRVLRTSTPQEFVQDLDAVLGDLPKPPVMVACEERAVGLLCNLREELDARGLQFLVPSQEGFNRTVDKGNLMELCTELGIECPQSWTAPKAMRARLAEEGAGPFVLKPRRGTGARGVDFLKNGEDLAGYEEKELEGRLLQEMVRSNDGVEGGFFLCRKGKVVGFYSHERIRTYPPSGGVTVYSRLSNNVELREIGSRLLGSLAWDGFAMIEWMKDKNDGNYKVIELNPRLWGSILLGEFSGARFLENYIRLAAGEETLPFKLKNEARIRWVFPYDLFLWIKAGGRIPGFWRRESDTCYIGKTYTSLARSVWFQFMNVLDPLSLLRRARRATDG